MALTLSAALLLSPVVPVQAAGAASEETRTGNVETYDSIDGLSGEILYDTDGNRVYTCGGEVHKIEENGETKYYWFGVDDLNEGSGWQNNHPGIHLYSSSDLYNWKYEGVMYEKEGELYAHPKMLFNGEEYVMWVSTGTKGTSTDYGNDMVPGPTKVLSSKSITGEFTEVEEQPDMGDSYSGFINLYEEARGNAYLIHYGNTSGTPGAPPTTICKTKLSADYKTTVGEIQPLNFSGDSLVSAEGGIFKQNGKYYIVNAGMNEYASANSLNGTWTKYTLQMWDGREKTDIKSKNQTSNVFRVRSGDSDLLVCVGDSVNGGSDPRYIWLPIKFFDDRTIALWDLSNWKLEDVEGVEPEGPGASGNYENIPGLSGRVMYDTNGNTIYACGGEVREFEENGQKKWYWFGVDDLNPEVMNEHPGVHLYSSSDLYNWHYEGVMLNQDGITYAHPKILHNGTQYVMWVSYMSMSSTPGGGAPSMPGGTTTTPSGGTMIATSDSITGPFTEVSDSEMKNYQGFINLYEESEGNAWLVYNGSSGTQGQICRKKLNTDYTGTVGEDQVFQFSSGALSSTEGGIFERDGKYYMVNTGSGQYAVADSFDGPWEQKSLDMWDGTEHKDIPRPNQTSSVFHVRTAEADTYVCIGDSVGGMSPDQAPVCYIWLPIEFFDDGTISLKEARDWMIAGMEPEKPEETKAPEGTAAPAETDRPVPTTQPEVTAQPGSTTKPEVTTQPEVTIKPGSTMQPESTVKPGSTTKPEITVKPGSTGKPVQTTKPETTAKPGSTGKPVQTTNPGATTKPGSTTNPEVSAKPGSTGKPTPPPEVTTKPGSTNKPEVTVKPGETIKPVQTMQPEEKPDATKTPGATNKPSGTAKPEETGTPTGTEKPVQTGTPEETAKPVEVKSVLVAAKKLTLGVGEKVQLEAAVYPRNAVDRKLTYKASNAKVKVTQSGKLTAKKQGISKITIAASNGKKAVVKVTIKKKPGKITLNPRNKTLKIGKKFKIKVRLPKGTASQTLTYVSNKRAIADVSPEGKVTAKKKGYAVITVKTYNGKKASLKVRVK